MCTCFSAFALEKVSFTTFSKSREEYVCSGRAFKNSMSKSSNGEILSHFHDDALEVVDLSFV